MVGSDVPSEKRTCNSLGSKTGTWETWKEAVTVIWARMMLVWSKVCTGLIINSVEFLSFGCYSNRMFCWIGGEAIGEERASFEFCADCDAMTELG